MLEVEHVAVYYGGALALEGISVAVAAREIVAIIGPNGAGKTTLLKAISGLVPHRGSIRFGSEPIDHLSPHAIVRRGIIHCPEGRQLFVEMSVQENLDLGAYLCTRLGEVERRRKEIYELFPQLWDRRAQIVSTLSGGEQQMVAIGRALMAEPRLLMLDEPSHGLAPMLKGKIVDSIRQIHERKGIPVVLVEQDSSLALELASRAYILEGGHVVQAGEAAALKGDSRVRDAYLGVG